MPLASASVDSRPNIAAQDAGARKLRVLFLHPKTLIDSWPVPIDTLGEIVKFPSAVYPVLAAMIGDLDVDIRILDGYVARMTLQAYRARLQWADLIAISCMSALKTLDTELTVRLAKTINPQVRIVVGGNHATAWPERWLETGVDFVVVGEGETAFRALVETILSEERRFESVPNLVWRDGDVVRRSAAKASPVDLDAMPMPDWSRFDLSPYGLGLSRGLGAAVELSRGCPHRCDFCNINTFWSYKQRYKSLDRVIGELERLKAAGIGEFIFTDDNFGGDERRTVALLEEMVRRRLDLRFGCFLRGDTVHRNPDFASLAYRAGMRFCMMGIETLDPDWLKAHRKGVRAADAIGMYRGIYERLRAGHIHVVGLFIVPPSADGPKPRARPIGVVCDYQFTADLAALRGSALFAEQDSRKNVSKDMFYHDWNLSSLYVDNGREQRSGVSFLHTLRENVSAFALRQVFIGPPLARRFRLRPVWILLERAFCTTLADIRRYRIAMSSRLTMQQKQDAIVRETLHPLRIAHLATARWFLSPLGLRTGVWTRSERKRA